jgi:hypothetical protein
LNRSNQDSPSEVQRQIHQIALRIFTDEPKTVEEEVDLKRMFVRILEKDDWTDKVASGLGKIRKVITRPSPNTKSSNKTRAVAIRPKRDAKPLKATRAKVGRPVLDPNLPEELRILVPDMRAVAEAYKEMTSGYKDFIREVVNASHLRQTRRRNASPHTAE